MDTLATLKKRVSYLVGETNYGTKTRNTIITDHINASIDDILNGWQFTWNLKSANLTLVAGSANLPTDFNPQWHINDARIVSTGDNNDSVFTEVSLTDRDRLTSDDYVYWITYDTTNKVFVFNSKTLTGTVAIYYNFLPTDLSVNTDTCSIHDGEAVAYLAASKIYVGSDPKNMELSLKYKQEADRRITSMYVKDLTFGSDLSVGNVVDFNATLTNSSVSEFLTLD